MVGIGPTLEGRTPKVRDFESPASPPKVRDFDGTCAHARNYPLLLKEIKSSPHTHQPPIPTNKSTRLPAAPREMKSGREGRKRCRTWACQNGHTCVCNMYSTCYKVVNMYARIHKQTCVTQPVTNTWMHTACGGLPKGAIHMK